MLKFLLQRKQKDKLNVLYGYTAIYMSRISMPASQQATSTCVQMQSIPLATASNSQQGKGISVMMSDQGMSWSYHGLASFQHLLACSQQYTTLGAGGSCIAWHCIALPPSDRTLYRSTAQEILHYFFLLYMVMVIHWL